MSDKFTLDVGQAVEIKHAFCRNGGTNADIKALCNGDMVAKLLPFLRGHAEIVVKSPLSFIRTFTAEALPQVTTTKSYFLEAGVVWMGGNFISQFIDLEVLATDARELSVDKIEESSFDVTILSQLGKKAGITVSQFRDFLSMHQETAGWFVFYLTGNNGNLWVVDAHWLPEYLGWLVNAYSIERRDERRDSWGAGYQVVSCK